MKLLLQELDTLESLHGNMGTDKEHQELTQMEQPLLHEHSQLQTLLKTHMKCLLFLWTNTELMLTLYLLMSNWLLSQETQYQLFPLLLMLLKALQTLSLHGLLFLIHQLQILFKVTMWSFRIKQELMIHCQMFARLQKEVVLLPVHVLFQWTL